MDKGGYLKWAPEIANLMMQGNSALTHQLLKDMAASSQLTYIRLQTPLPADLTAMDQAASLKKLRSLALQTLDHQVEDVHKVVDLLYHSILQSHNQHDYVQRLGHYKTLPPVLQVFPPLLRTLRLQQIRLDPPAVFQLFKALSAAPHLQALEITGELEDLVLQLAGLSLRDHPGVESLILHSPRFTPHGLKTFVQSRPKRLVFLDIQKETTGSLFQEDGVPLDWGSAKNKQYAQFLELCSTKGELLQDLRLQGYKI